MDFNTIVNKALWVKILIGVLGVIIAALQGIQVESTGTLVATDQKLLEEVKVIQAHQAEDLDKILDVVHIMETNQLNNLKAQLEFNQNLQNTKQGPPTK
jgi:hypothetical protein